MRNDIDKIQIKLAVTRSLNAKRSSRRQNNIMPKLLLAVTRAPLRYYTHIMAKDII